MSERQHTPGEWQYEPGDQGDPFVGDYGYRASVYSPCGPQGDPVEICLLSEPIAEANQRCYGDGYENGRLIVAACNSYDRHFGPRAVEAAEADALGIAIEALRMIANVEFSRRARDALERMGANDE